jgi:hypothetical protein
MDADLQDSPDEIPELDEDDREKMVMILYPDGKKTV